MSEEKASPIKVQREIKIGFGEFITSLIVTAVIGAICVATIMAADAVHPVFLAIAGFFFIVAYLRPTLTAFNVGNDYDTDEFEGGKHKHRVIIFLLNLIFGGTGLVWIALFYWSYHPGTIEVTLKEQKSDE